MKNNVDLTLDRVFSEAPVSRIISRLRIKKKFPWSRPQGGLSATPYESLILTGTSSERQDKKLSLEFYEQQKVTCDCCGKRIFPWNHGVCTECNGYLEQGLFRSVYDVSKLNAKSSHKNKHPRLARTS